MDVCGSEDGDITTRLRAETARLITSGATLLEEGAPTPPAVLEQTAEREDIAVGFGSRGGGEKGSSCDEEWPVLVLGVGWLADDMEALLWVTIFCYVCGHSKYLFFVARAFELSMLCG